MTFKWAKNIAFDHILVGYAYILSLTSVLLEIETIPGGVGSGGVGSGVGKHVVKMLSQFN